MNIDSSVRGISFDVGGVLQLPDPEAVRRALAHTGKNPSSDQINAAHYIALSATESTHERADYRAWMHHYLKTLGVADDQVDDSAARLERTFTDAGAWSHVVPGAHETLKELARRGFRLAIISNTLVPGAVALSLRRAGVCQVGEGSGVRVDAVVDSGEVGFIKPDPRIFQVALDAMATTPDETVHVGDSLAADVSGAYGVGLTPIHFDPLRLCRESGHQHVDRLLGLLDLFPG